MGCYPSTPRISNKSDRNVKRTHNIDSRAASSNDIHVKVLTDKQVFQQITTGIKQISNPADLVPQVCVGEGAFPIATAVFKLEEPDGNEIRLPIISCSVKGNGYCLCVSSIDYLIQQNFQNYDTTLLFKQITRAISGQQKTFIQTFCLGFTRSDIRVYKSSFESMNLFIEGGVDFPQNLQNYSVVVLNTSYVLTPEQMDILYAYITEDGNGLITFYNPADESPNINDFLMRFGIRFTNLVSGDENDTIEVGQSYELAHDLTFKEISDKYEKLIESDNINQIQLNDLVSSLRIYVLACGDENTPRLSHLLDCSWEYLKRTNYIVGNTLFQTQQQSTVSLLILDLLQKLPLELLKPVDGFEIFPGVTGNVELKDFEIDLTINSQEWTSTGLWLPAGVMGEVIIENVPPSTFIQIGCHNEKNLPKKLPWGRWPSTLVTEPVITEETKVGSPYGGIVYLMNGEEEELISYDIHAKFCNFCEFPRYVMDTDTWERTKDIEVPWGEIETSNVILTMPSDSLRRVDVDMIAKRLDSLVANIKDYLNIEWDYKFRIIFDVMVDPGEPSISYPIAFSTKDIDNVVEGFKFPSKYLFDLLVGVAASILQTAWVDDVTKMAISSVAASAALSKVYDGFSPMLLEDVELPPLFHELWEIHVKCDMTLFAKVLAAIRESALQQSDVPEDMWISFVRTLSTIGNIDFSNLLSRTKPIPLSVINSLRTLHPYKM